MASMSLEPHNMAPDTNLTEHHEHSEEHVTVSSVIQNYEHLNTRSKLESTWPVCSATINYFNI